MNLTQFCVKRPVLTAMVTAMSVLIGGVSMTRIQTDLLPEVEAPTISVITEYSGASPQVMEQRVTQILEEILATVPGVIELRSQSSLGLSEVQVTFGWGTNLDAAALDLSTRIENEMSELPADITRPRVRKFDTTSFPIVLVGISSEIDPVALTSLVESQIRRRLSRIPMVAQVDTWGGFEREVRIELELKRLQALSLSVEEVAESIRKSNIDLPAGQLDIGRQEVTLRAPAEFKNLDDIGEIAVLKREQRIVRLNEIAGIKDTYKRLTRLVQVNGKPGLRLAIRKQADANTAEVSRRVVEALKDISYDYPQIDIIPLINQGDFIERSIANVARSVVYGGGLAVLVLLFFLLSIRSTVAIALAIPVSITSTFAMIYWAGLTLNLTTLGGLALGVGMMVDSSIVVLENIYRRKEQNGDSPDIASIVGTGEVASALLASTLTTSVVFLPISFIKGLSLLLFLDMAYVVVLSLTCSLLVSITVLPALTAYLLKTDSKQPHSTSTISLKSAHVALVVNKVRSLTARLEVSYINVLRGVLKNCGVTLFIAISIFVLSLFLVPYIGSELLPPSDEGEIRISADYEVGTRLDLMSEGIESLEALTFPQVPEIQSSASYGVTPGRFSDTSRAQLILNVGSAGERTRSSQEIANALRETLENRIDGGKVKIRAPKGNFVLTMLLRTESGIDVEIQGFDLQTLEQLGETIRQRLDDIPGVTDVELNRRKGIPQVDIEIDRRRVESLGLSPQDVGRTLEASVAGVEVGNFRNDDQSYRIFVQLASVRDLEIDEVLELPLKGVSGQSLSLRNVVSARQTTGPVMINRKNQQRIVTVSADISGRDSGTVAEDVQGLIDDLVIPSGYQVGLSGAIEEQRESFQELVQALLLALLLIYMVLASQYESLLRPLVVMLSIPLGAAGVFSVLFSTKTTLNIQTYIGCIMLGGILVNNAILLVDQAQSLLKSGLLAKAAVLEAGRRRFRPILMTTATTVLGLAPLAMGWGEGADAQAPLARTVIGGLIGSTPLTLLVIPVVFVLFQPKVIDAKSH